MIRAQIHRVLNRSKDLLLFNPLLTAHWVEKLRGTVTCLVYHRIDRPENHAFLTRGGVPVIEPEDFFHELRFLLDNGVKFWTFDDLLRKPFPESTEIVFIISIDDGFLDCYTNGVDVLDSLSIKAVFFQSTGLVDSESLIWEHDLYWHTRDSQRSTAFTAFVHRVHPNSIELRSRSGRRLVEYLREDCPPEMVEHILEKAREPLGSATSVAGRIYPRAEFLRRAHEQGHQIGSHGHNHYKRRNIDSLQFKTELEVSSKRLGEILGYQPRLFSFPFNSYAHHDDEICSEFFDQVATVDARRITEETSPLWLPRFTWMGPMKNRFRQRRWQLTGSI